MNLSPKKKTLLMNLGLLLGVAAILFRGYLPVAEEITLQNQQLKTYENQIASLKSSAGTSPSEKEISSPNMKVFALPQDSLEHISQELEVLAHKPGMKFIQIEPKPEEA